jgi:hypothetical protein
MGGLSPFCKLWRLKMATIDILVHFKDERKWQKIALKMGRYHNSNNRIAAFGTMRKEDIDCIRLASDPDGYCWVGHEGKRIEFT